MTPPCDGRCSSDVEHDEVNAGGDDPAPVGRLRFGPSQSTKGLAIQSPTAAQSAARTTTPKQREQRQCGKGRLPKPSSMKSLRDLVLAVGGPAHNPESRRSFMQCHLGRRVESTERTRWEGSGFAAHRRPVSSSHPLCHVGLTMPFCVTRNRNIDLPAAIMLLRMSRNINIRKIAPFDRLDARDDAPIAGTFKFIEPRPMSWQLLALE